MDELLDRAPRCVLAFEEERMAVLVPLAFWSDGANLWLPSALDAAEVAALLRQPRCALWIPPLPEDGGARGLVCEGSARVFSARDPRGLALHGPTLSAAVGALTVKYAGTLFGLAQDAPRLPLSRLLRQQALIKVAIDRLRAVGPPDPGPGIAPALPTVVPSEVRRRVAGARRVVVATLDDDLEVGPGTWGAGYALRVPPGRELVPGVAVTVAVGIEGDARPSRVTGLALHGTVDARAVLRPTQATWWNGFRLDTAPLAATTGAVVLPD